MITIIYIALALWFAKGILEILTGIFQILLGVTQGIFAMMLDAKDYLLKPCKSKA
jgi:hypothetical protein